MDSSLCCLSDPASQEVGGSKSLSNLWMGMEMTNKQLEKRVRKLEKEISELKSSLLALAIRPAPTQAPIMIPNTQPFTNPVCPQPWPLPYIGDIPGHGGITCTTAGVDRTARVIQ